MLALLGRAAAELPPPDYHTTLVEAAGKEVARVAQEATPDEADTFARRWMRTFGRSARVTYELGLVWRLAGDDARALKSLDEAVALDPELATARYDRGEIRLAAGELAGAREDFEAVVRLQPDAWPGWFRLAQLDGLAGDAEAFEAHLLRALRCGFQVRAVAKDPTWRRLRADAAIGPVFERLVLVYQGAAVLEEMDGASP